MAIYPRARSSQASIEELGLRDTERTSEVVTRTQHRLCINVSILLAVIAVVVAGMMMTLNHSHNLRHDDARYEIAFLESSLKATEKLYYEKCR